MSNLILFNKPYRVLSQFTDNEGRSTLADFIKCNDFYPAGRLDYDSEGLLLLTNNGALQDRIANPEHKLPKTYWAQVEGAPTEKSIRTLADGVHLKDGMTQRAKVRQIAEPDVWPRIPPIRQRMNSPTSWLEITICEGRNRQVRRMTAAVELPTLRLIRWKIGEWTLNDLEPGEYRKLDVHMPVVQQKSKSKYQPKTKRPTP